MSRGHGRHRRRSYAGRQRELRQRGPRPSFDEVESQLPGQPPQVPPAPQAAADGGEQGLARR